MLKSVEEISLTEAYSEGAFTADELEAHAGPDFSDLVQINPETAIRVVDAFAGTRIHVPAKLNPKGAIADKINIDHANVLIGLFQGEYLSVPRFMALKRKIRNRQICKLRKGGQQINQLACDFKLTERQVLYILSQSKDGHRKGHSPKA